MCDILNMINPSESLPRSLRGHKGPIIATVVWELHNENLKNSQNIPENPNKWFMNMILPLKWSSIPFKFKNQFIYRNTLLN